MSDAKDILPRDKHDLERLAVLREGPLSDLAPHLDAAVGWLADSNWPVARPLSQNLFALGHVIIPSVLVVLKGSDGVAKWHLLSLIPESMPHETAAALRHELERLAVDPSPNDRQEDVNLLAEEALAWLDRSPADKW